MAGHAGAEEIGAERARRIEAALREAFAPLTLEIEDESHKHRGHAGAADGRGHFRVHIVAAAFAGKTRVQRHRMVYVALGAQLETDIHALAIRAESPQEQRTDSA
jgi:BolA family transcriptional regulator, general stress-responsive regulator